MPLANSAPTIVADLTGMRDAIVARATRMSDTSTVRAALPTSDLYEGLEFYETNTGKTMRYLAGAWKRVDIKRVRFNNTTAASPAGMISVAHNYGEVPGAITVATNPVDPANGGFVEMARRAHPVVWDSPLGANSVQIRFSNIEGTDWLGGIGIAGWITVYPNI